MPIDETQVRRIAHLSRLALKPEELHTYTQQLEGVLAYIEKLKEVDVTGVEPMSHPLPITDVLRDDQPRDSLALDQVLSNAPQSEAGFFRVPAVLDPNSGA